MLLTENSYYHVISGYFGDDTMTHFSASGAYNSKTVNSMNPIIFFSCDYLASEKETLLIIFKNFYEADFWQMQKGAILK